jgi:tetratricopeptide (TPR) repeat protein
VSARDEPTGLLTRQPAPAGYPEEAKPPAPEDDLDLSLGEEETPPAVDLGQARSFLTELRPSGFGELLVTDVWFAPAPPPKKPARKSKEAEPEQKQEPPPPPNRQQTWERRHELRELNLLRERPAASFDARTEHYWGQVKEGLRKAPEAIVDPYTELVTEFAEIDHGRLQDRRRELREYGREAESRVALGRAYLAIGRLRSARDTFRAAAKEDAFHAAAWWHLGVASLFARAYPEASAALTRALDQTPGDLRIETALGLARFHERKYEQAEEHLRRTAGGGARAACRSLLCCSLRAQAKWHEARAELNLLRHGDSPQWAAVAEQCLDCVERGEQKEAGALRVRRSRAGMLRSLATAVAGAAWLAYAVADHLFKSDLRIALVPLFGLVLLLGRSLRGISGKEQSSEFGNYEQGLPCWQTTTWARPRRAEF